MRLPSSAITRKGWAELRKGGGNGSSTLRLLTRYAVITIGYCYYAATQLFAAKAGEMFTLGIHIKLEVSLRSCFGDFSPDFLRNGRMSLNLRYNRIYLP